MVHFVSVPPPPNRVRRILVVDDDPARLELISRTLRHDGHEVDCLSDAAGLFDHIAARPPDLVLLDVMLPGASGIELVADMRMIEELKLVPIILFTAAVDDEESVVRGLMCGADDYITAPWRVHELRARVHVQLRNRRERELLAWSQAQGARLRHDALRDPLTGLANRRAVDRAVDEMLREGVPFVMLLLDVDHFKSINDTYGHAAGDEVLRYMGSLLGSGARQGDVAGRYGGEEFVVVARGATESSAASIANRYLEAVRNMALPPQAGVRRVTTSIGVVWYDPLRGVPTARAQVFAAADEALYLAKRGGRDRVVLLPVRHSIPIANGNAA
jgi:diguanylate cyclase (GGDEF)-like protein